MRRPRFPIAPVAVAVVALLTSAYLFGRVVVDPLGDYVLPLYFAAVAALVVGTAGTWAAVRRL